METRARPLPSQSQFILLSVIIALCWSIGAAQSQDNLTPKTSAPRSDQLNLSTPFPLVISDANSGVTFSANKASTDVTKTPQLEFRIERLPVAGGSELLTLFGRLRPDGNSNQEA